MHHDVKQQHVYDVLKYINNPLYHKEFLNIAQNFDVEANSQHYKVSRCKISKLDLINLTKVVEITFTIY